MSASSAIEGPTILHGTKKGANVQRGGVLPRLPLPFNERCPIHGNGSFCFWWRTPYSFYNKISGSSLDQWVPRSLNTCCRLIYDALSSDAIEEVEFEDGEVVDRRWILHHFDFSSFRIFGSLMILQCQPLVLVVQLLGGTIMRVTSSGHFNLGTFAVTGVPTHWYYWVGVYY
jgi:hypothetical protein